MQQTEPQQSVEPTATAAKTAKVYHSADNCPECKTGMLSSVHQFVPMNGIDILLVTWECSNNAGENPLCTYRRVV